MDDTARVGGIVFAHVGNEPFEIDGTVLYGLGIPFRLFTWILWVTTGHHLVLQDTF